MRLPKKGENTRHPPVRHFAVCILANISSEKPGELI
jgi:hypothetical protein